MKNEVLKKLDEVSVETLNWVQQFAEQGIEFIETQAPLLCQEIIVYNRILYSIGVSIPFIVGCIWLIIYFKVTKPLYKIEKWNNLQENTAVASNIIPIFGFIISLVFFSLNLKSFIKVWFAPRVFLLEYFSNLIN